MHNIFNYDNSSGILTLDTHELLLIKEFADLYDVNRNKTKTDPKGIKRELAWKEFKYIWLFCDWKSPYQQYIERDKHNASLLDSGLTEEEWLDPVFRAAVNKYQEIQGSSRVLNLIKTAYRTLEKMRIYLDNLDFDERDMNNKPIFKAKEILDNLGSINIITTRLQELENSYKNEMADTGSKNRGDSTPGFDDN